MKKRHFYLGLSVMLVIAGCAQQGSPSGGPKDEKPPAVLSAEPANYSKHFSASRISIDFDEYIVLDNVNQELVVSPPLEEKPVVKLKGKTLIIDIPGELHENTTYTFNFGNAIKDLHEGNKLQNYEYVFSTGAVLDSLSVRGQLQYAFDRKAPEEPMFIMLYGDLRDSVPLLEPPFYVGRSDDKGQFSVNNLRPDVYKLFAIKDANNNFLFDQPTEEIAFLDSSLIVSAEYFKKIIEAGDSSSVAAQDSTGISLISTAAVPDSGGLSLISTAAAPDSASVPADSIPGYKKYNSIYVDLFVFTEENTLQYLSDFSRKDRRRLDLVFSRPVSDSFSIKALDTESMPEKWYLMQKGLMKDSISLWIPDSLVYKRDSIYTVVAFTISDSAGMPATRYDTLLFAYRPSGSKSSKKQATPEKFSVRTISKGGQQELNRDLMFTGSVPLSGVEADKILLNMVIDSVETAVPFSLVLDSARIDRAFLKTGWASGSDYHMILYPGAFTSLFGETNDTTELRFKSRDLEYYGNLSLELNNVEIPVILELYSGDKRILTRTITQSGVCLLDYLAPQKYRIKFILDRNGNGKWDTGKYLQKRQPEQTEWFPKEIEVRSNWDQSESYTFK